VEMVTVFIDGFESVIRVIYWKEINGLLRE